MISIEQLIQILEEIHSNYLQMGFNRTNKTTVVNTAGIRKWCRDYLKEEVTEDNND